MDALSHKSSGNLYYIRIIRMPLLIELRKLGVELKMGITDGLLATLRIRPMLMERILQAQLMDKESKKMCDDVKSGKMKDLNHDNKEILKFENRLYVLNIGNLRR